MKFLRILFVTAIILYMYSCQTTEPTISRTVQPLDQGISASSNPIIYALPRTVLRVEATALKITSKRGPYYRYGKKYLDIEEGIEQDHVDWVLSDVKIDSYEDIDPEQYYVVNSTGNVYSNYMQLTRQGLILCSNPNMYRGLKTIQEPVSEEENVIFFGDKSVKKNLNQKSDTVYRLIESDTGFVRVPHVQLRSNLKSDDQKAKEASDFIIKVRKRRFKLLSGQYDVFPEGLALEYAVKELTRLENEYLALFVGKKIIEEKMKTFEFIPEKEQNGNGTVLFRFSLDNGIVPENDLTGRPINLRIEELNDAGQFAKLENQDETIKRSDLVYRVPNPCNIEVVDGKTVLSEKRLLVNQLGTIFRLPDNLYLSPQK